LARTTLVGCRQGRPHPRADPGTAADAGWHVVPLHILQAPRGQLKLAARAKNDMAELERLNAEPLGELPEVYRKQPIYYITNRFSVRGPTPP